MTSREGCASARNAPEAVWQALLGGPRLATIERWGTSVSLDYCMQMGSGRANTNGQLGLSRLGSTGGVAHRCGREVWRFSYGWFQKAMKNNFIKHVACHISRLLMWQLNYLTAYLLGMCNTMPQFSLRNFQVKKNKVSRKYTEKGNAKFGAPSGWPAHCF